jgi:hypothetical protein
LQSNLATSAGIEFIISSKSLGGETGDVLFVTRVSVNGLNG